MTVIYMMTIRNRYTFVEVARRQHKPPKHAPMFIP